jgi:hypothetical protein
MRLFNIVLSIAIPLFLISCTDVWRGKLDQSTLLLVDEALNNAGKNKGELVKALKNAPDKQLNGVAFLIAYMPQVDRDSLKAEFLLENTKLAYAAKEKFPWCKSLPDSVFFNEVLPYAVLNERRDNWRQDFYDRFLPKVDGCDNIYAAIDSVNRNIAKILKVEYNVKRRKVDQSPYESIEQGMATCTGLSILLVDAFRTVGIPSRLAGIANWTTKRGNHNWVEVFVDGKWYFTEYYPDALNKSWFVADAGKADPEKPENSIFATSFKPLQTWFPLIWDKDLKYIHAENVTLRYIDVYNEQLLGKVLSDDEVILNVVLFKNETCTPDGNNRIHTKILLLQEGKQIDFGFSPSSTDDMNKYLVFRVKKNSKYKLEYFAPNGNLFSKEIKTIADPEMTQRLYLEEI